MVILVKLVEMVVGLDDDEDGQGCVSDLLFECGVDNVVVIVGDFKFGKVDQGLYNVIFVNGVVEEVLQVWFDQFVDGG